MPSSVFSKAMQLHLASAKPEARAPMTFCSQPCTKAHTCRMPVRLLKEGKIRLSSSGKVSKPLQEDVIGPFVHSVMPRLLLHAGPAKTARTLVVLGSGGHTAEMLALLKHLDKDQLCPRTYVIASTDSMGAQKALAAEKAFTASKEEGFAQANIVMIPRSREVGQSYLTSIWTTLVAAWAAVAIVWREAPQLVLVNGPGTCIPLCFAAHVFRLFRWHTRIVYVESIARVESLSLSGKVLYHTRMADAFFVQWPHLQQNFPRSTYRGSLY